MRMDYVNMGDVFVIQVSKVNFVKSPYLVLKIVTIEEHVAMEDVHV